MFTAAALVANGQGKRITQPRARQGGRETCTCSLEIRSSEQELLTPERGIAQDEQELAPHSLTVLLPPALSGEQGSHARGLSESSPSGCFGPTLPLQLRGPASRAVVPESQALV